MDFRLSFEGLGEVSVSERRKPADPDAHSYESDDLVDRIDDVKLDVYSLEKTPRKGACVLLDMNAYHIENDDTGRAFHTSVGLHLTRAEITTLRDFLDFIIEHADDADPE
jgi:hypothetical protein